MKRIQGSIAVVKVEPSSKPSLPIRRSSRLRSLKDIISTMPSYLRSPRSYSYPPCIDSVEWDAPVEADLPDIDDEPFAHFLTPVVEEDDPYDGLSLSAGIIVSEGPRASKTTKFKSNVADKWARYIKQTNTPLHTRYHESSSTDEDDEDDESFMQLDDHRLNDTPHVVAQLTNSPPRVSMAEPTRGRAQELVSRKKSNSRRRYSRTLSGHRHSWREPSPDLFTVDESEEEESPVLRRSTKTRKAKDGVERRRSRVRDVVERSRL